MIDIAHAPKAKAHSADDEIVRIVRADAVPGAIRVVTSDRTLTDLVHAAGASVEGSSAFRARIEDH